MTHPNPQTESTSTKPKSAPVVSVRKWCVDAESLPQRLDNFIYKKLSGVPLSRIYRAIRKGEVRVNGRRAKPSYRLQAQDELRIPPLIEKPRPTSAAHEPGRVQRLRQMLLFKTDGLLVFNKPPGWAVHGGSGVSAGFIETVRAAYADERSLELVHRLDRDTSGCLLIARRRSVLRELHALFRQNKVYKKYLCLAAGGDWPQAPITISAPLGKIVLPNGERRSVVTDTGVPAVTRFKRLAANDQLSLLRAQPASGRMHQIRVHAKHQGHPLIGDDKYGDAAANRLAGTLGFSGLALHATSLAFTLGDEPIKVSAPLPKSFASLLRRLGWDEISKI